MLDLEAIKARAGPPSWQRIIGRHALVLTRTVDVADWEALIGEVERQRRQIEKLTDLVAELHPDSVGRFDESILAGGAKDD